MTSHPTGADSNRPRPDVLPVLATIGLIAVASLVSLYALATLMAESLADAFGRGFEEEMQKTTATLRTLGQVCEPIFVALKLLGPVLIFLHYLRVL